ncbi:unnamed protein product [Effrenium voratum]|uniref:Protein kinase domain-containing protein n=1 Tax=Effrenium voratum TaxID=2562239 RepID=A0AA36I5U3_9DINO|nr:unnamed protein product [Effrenium voratum]CAJ1453516.1 unnamed protein product [Effrenium voratum]
MVRRVKEVAASADRLNQYQLLGEAGRGSFCRVLLASSSEGSHAVKSFSRTELQRSHVARFDAEGVRTVPLGVSLEEELRILSKLSHPHVISLQEVIDDPRHDSIYVILEGLPGGQLMDWKRECCAYSVASAAAGSWGSAVQDCDSRDSQREVLVFQEILARYFCRQLAEGIEHMHRQSVIHKDLKPDNLVLSRPIPADRRCVRVLGLAAWPQLSGSRGCSEELPGAELLQLLREHALQVKIADFNSAEECAPPRCLIYDAQGTQHFTPPECFLGSDLGVPGKPRDMWSLGCVLFVLLFGHCPFWAEENNLLLQLNILSDKQVEMPTGGPELSAAVLQLLQSLLSKDAAKRPSAEGVLQSSWLK